MANGLGGIEYNETKKLFLVFVTYLVVEYRSYEYNVL